MDPRRSALFMGRSIRAELGWGVAHADLLAQADDDDAKIRAAIQANADPAWIAAECHGISEQTVWKSRNRDSIHDYCLTPHRLQTTLTSAQDAVTVALCKSQLTLRRLAWSW